MFLLLSRSRRLAALLTAGVLGIAPLAAAPVPTAPPVAASTEPADKVQELQVELAWMTDPVTFRCPIRAHAIPTGIELTGFVPSADAHKLAVNLAREICGGRVRDAIRVTKLSNDSYTPAKSAEVVRAAKVALHDVLGQKSQGIEVTSPANGEVILRGSVASWREKHAAGSRMRRLSGCSCVVNLLELPGEKPHTVQDKSKKEPGKLATLPAKPLPAPVAQAAPVHRSVIQRVAAWVSPYGGQPEAATDKVIASTTPAQPAQPVASSKPSPYGRTVTPPLPTAQKLELVPEPQLPWNSTPLPVKKQASEPKVVLPAEKSATVAVPLPKAEPLVSVEEPQVPAPPKPVAKPPRSLFGSLFQKAEPAAPKPEPTLRVEEKRMTIATSTGPAETVTRSPEVSPAPATQPARPTLFASIFGHSESAPPKTKSVPPGPATIPDRPYVTTGTVTFHDEAPPAPMPLPSPAILRQKLLQACSGTVKDVQVKTRPDGDLLVTVKVAGEKAIESLTGTVLHLPEMQSPRVHLSCEVAP